MIAPGEAKIIGGYTFKNWGSHSDNYPCIYMTAAAAIGLEAEEIDTFLKRLEKIFLKFKRKHIPDFKPRDQIKEKEGET